VATQLTEHEGDKQSAVNAVLENLKGNKMLSLGETGAITPEVSEQILNLAVAE
jgi:NADP-dependent alcohol dehydrogenase